MNESEALLQSAYRRWLALEEEKTNIQADLKELMAELKAQGFTPKSAREAFRRERNAADAEKSAADQAFEDEVDLYRAALARDAHVMAAA